MISYKDFLKQKKQTGESTKVFDLLDDMDVELGQRPDIKPVITLGNGIEPELPKIEKKPLDFGEPLPKKRKGKESTPVQDTMAGMGETLKEFIEHCKKTEEAQKSDMQEFMSLYARANNLK